jgi:uncharacterized protein
MIVDVVAQQDAIEELCRRYGVQSLYVFGSADRDAMTDESDVDFLVTFDNPVIPGYADRYFGLLEGLEDLLGRRVDLVVESTISNPYFRKSVEQSRVLLYAA